MLDRRYMLIIVLLAAPLLGGGQCAFFFSSGGGSSGPDDDTRRGLTVAVNKDGQFVDSPVEGVRYRSGSITGITGSNGEFQYEEGNTVQFFIGDIALGAAVAGQALITPLDLVADGKIDSTAVINIARLLQSLDWKPGDGIITIPETVHTAAVRSNELVSPYIEYLDFADEAAFVNSASQLLAILTNDYPFTAALVDAGSAREHLIRSLEILSRESK